MTEPRVSVIICTYSEDRWDDLVRAVSSVRAQTGVDAELIVVVDHNAALLERVTNELEPVQVTENAGPRGLSGARNSGIAVASGEIVAFLDDDAVAETDWLAQLVTAYEDPRVVGVGGRIDPAWDTGRPSYFPEEFDWVVGCTYRGMPDHRASVRNVIGANMSFRRSAFESVGGFVDGVGRVGTVPRGCEETELCIRVRRADPSCDIVYEPAAVVRHRVFPARGRPGYFFSRCLAEGQSKAMVARLTSPGDALATERVYVSRVLPRGIARGLADAAHGRLAGLARAALIVFGTLVTAASYARYRLVGDA